MAKSKDERENVIAAGGIYRPKVIDFAYLSPKWQAECRRLFEVGKQTRGWGDDKKHDCIAFCQIQYLVEQGKWANPNDPDADKPKPGQQMGLFA